MHSWQLRGQCLTETEQTMPERLKKLCETSAKKRETGAKRRNRAQKQKVHNFVHLWRKCVVLFFVRQRKALQGIDLQMLTVPCVSIGSQLIGRLGFGNPGSFFVVLLFRFCRTSCRNSNRSATSNTQGASNQRNDMKTKHGPGKSIL